jgi:hypothetical protein
MQLCSSIPNKDEDVWGTLGEIYHSADTQYQDFPKAFEYYERTEGRIEVPYSEDLDYFMSTVTGWKSITKKHMSIICYLKKKETKVHTILLACFNIMAKVFIKTFLLHSSILNKF